MFVVKVKRIVVAVILIAVFVFLAVGVPSIVVAASPKPNYVVVLDAGHGGADGGVVGVNTGVCEREINMIITYKVKALLEKQGVGVELTRDSGVGAEPTITKKQEDMKLRKEKILKAKPNLVVSIHQNKYSSPNRRGAQVFYWGDDTLAKSLQAVMNEEINKVNQGRTYSALKGDYYILQCTEYPSALVECGFLSSPLDEALLVTDEYQNKIAKCIAQGIMNFLVA
ncbi:MAG: N-acetylmuramoyl-L-alanine amidase [Eubacteriales bacterium]|nr:N-acetylmuramoyl-L-alanine amidase [Eubacteriales bacterium]